MLYTIENDKICVQISDIGGEMMSIQLKEDGCEYLWQGDPQYWAGRAYNLFPICGRLTEGKYTYKGQTYEMVLHGFSRNETMTVVEQSQDSITFCLTDTEKSREQYPFGFEYKMSYILEDTTIYQTFSVNNTGDEELIFCVGAHPGFNVPLMEGEAFEDYYIEFESAAEPKQAVMSEACFDTGERVPYPLEEGKILRLRHDLFDNDAIFLEEMCDTVTLKCTRSDKFVTLYYPEMNALGLWHKPKTEAPYVCIEPWYGLPSFDGVVDDFETKSYMVHLPVGEIYTNTMDITIG